MGLYKRGSVWWMSFVHKSQYYRKSTETDDQKLAKRIYDKIKGQIAEGKWFERLPGEEKTFREMMEKYLKEHASKLISEKSFQGYAKNLLSFFGDYTLSEITPRLVNEYKTKRREDGLKASSINRELATMKKAFKKKGFKVADQRLRDILKDAVGTGILTGRKVGKKKIVYSLNLNPIS